MRKLDGLPRIRQVGEQARRIGICIPNLRPDGHAYDYILAVRAMLESGHAVAAVAAGKSSLVSKCEQRVDVLVAERDDIAASAAVAAVRSAARHELFAPSADAAISAIAAAYVDKYLVYHILSEEVTVIVMPFTLWTCYAQTAVRCCTLSYGRL